MCWFRVCAIKSTAISRVNLSRRTGVSAMPLRLSSPFYRTLGFRFTLWYSGIFIVSSLTLSILSYVFVFSSMRDERRAIQSQLRQYASLVETGGVAALESKFREQRNPNRDTSFFTRIIDSAN